jgi:hypothetical protein
VRSRCRNASSCCREPMTPFFRISYRSSPTLSHHIPRCIIQNYSSTTRLNIELDLYSHRTSARHICTRVREWLRHSMCHNLGAAGGAPPTVARRIDVDDLEAQAVVDRLLHRHRSGRRARCAGSRPGRAAAGGVLLQARDPHPGLAIGRRRSHRRDDGRPDRCPARGRARRRSGGALARRRVHT